MVVMVDGGSGEIEPMALMVGGPAHLFPPFFLFWWETFSFSVLFRMAQ
jgi:hypothetical protein